MNKLKFTGLIQELADSEVIGLIDPVKLKEIRMRDKHPLFRAYSLGHEGESSGSLVGIGKVIKKWVKGAIQMLAEKLKIGTKVFWGHVKGTNEHSGRTQIGELVGKTTKTIKDKFHTIGIIYIHKEHRDKDLDISSIEADADFDLTQDSMNQIKVNAGNINEVSGIVLANSAFEKPGFPGATLQAQFQELVKEESTHIGGSMTVEEIKQFIQQGGIIPSELFTENDLVADPKVLDYITKEKNRAGYSGRKESNGKVSEIEKDYETKISKLEKDLGKERNVNLKRKAIDTLKVKMDDGRKLDEKQKAFLEFDFDKKFKIENPDKWEKEVDSYIDTRLEEYDKNLEIFGLKEKTQDVTDAKTGGIKAATKPLSITDYTDPEQNEFIPKSK